MKKVEWKQELKIKELILDNLDSIRFDKIERSIEKNRFP